MSLPHLLLVDDSEAILAFERAALSGHYAVTTAVNGGEALAKLASFRPAAVLLDLSMPVMDGDEVLARMQADAQLKDIPVIVISSEKARAEACLSKGAAASLAKPIRADELLLLVDRVLRERAAKAKEGALAVLELSAGKISLAIPLSQVVSVHPQVKTRPLPGGPDYLSELIDVEGEPLCVLDLAKRLGQAHTSPLLERKLVVVRSAGTKLCLCVDAVRDPEEFPPDAVTPRHKLGAGDHSPLRECLVAVVRTPTGVLPVVDAGALLSEALQKALGALAAGAPGSHSL